MLENLKKSLRIDFSKNTKLGFYLKGLWILFSPAVLFKKDLINKYATLGEDEKLDIQNRIDYYNKLDESFELTSDAISVKQFIRKEKKKTYFFDLLEYLKYFNKNKKISYIFGDVVEVPLTPSIVKSRPIKESNYNSVLMKLNKVRHFIFVDDTREYELKIDKAVWRGKCYREYRKNFVQKFYDSPLCNIGQVNTRGDTNVPWQKEKLSLHEQLEYKFIVAIEGNDVASNLKWAMSSNSLVLMAKPKYETWFMEGTLIENVHYGLLDDNYENLEEKIKYYLQHSQEAKKIIANANSFTQKFKNKDYEDIISYKVLEKYFKRQK